MASERRWLQREKLAMESYEDAESGRVETLSRFRPEFLKENFQAYGWRTYNVIGRMVRKASDRVGISKPVVRQKQFPTADGGNEPLASKLLSVHYLPFLLCKASIEGLPVVWSLVEIR